MNGPVITMGPTLTNPEALKTVSALRNALNLANVNILELTMQLSEERGALRNCSRALANLVFLYIAGDVAGLQAELEHLVAQMKRPVDKPDQAPTPPERTH